MTELFALGTREHTVWLRAQTERLLTFYHRAADFEFGGFDELSDAGQPLGKPKMLYGTARMTYSYALGQLLCHEGSSRFVEHGLRALRQLFHDDQHGGWVASMSADGASIENGAKQTYGHAFVLLAAAAAREAGFEADDLIDEATAVFARYLYDVDDQLCVDSWDRSWRSCDTYRGLNANMHAFESFLGAYSATGKEIFVERARGIGARMISFASSTQWRIPEHFTTDWEPLLEFNVERPGDQFRPYGVTPGHGLEWARLLLQLDTTSVDALPGALDAAERLFDRAVVDAFDERRRGFAYTVDWRGRTVMPQRLHWPLAEAIGAARCLFAETGDSRYSEWYQRFWQLADSSFIDHERGSWWHELDVTGTPGTTIWEGKGDLYHSLQATLFGQFPVAPTLIGYLARRSVATR